MDISNVLFAFGLTVLAGLSTGIGSALAFYTKRTNKTFLSAALGFSAGVMIYVSMIEIFPKARESLELVYGPSKGYWVTTIGFFAGIALIALIDRFVPEAQNPHEMPDVNEMATTRNQRLMKKQHRCDGAFLHLRLRSFPRFSDLLGALRSGPGISITIAIAITIFRGIAVSIDLLQQAVSVKPSLFILVRRLSLWGLSSTSCCAIFLTMPCSGLYLLLPVMVYISLDELRRLPKNGQHHHVGIYGLIAGMAVMALSLLLLG